MDWTALTDGRLWTLVADGGSCARTAAEELIAREKARIPGPSLPEERAAWDVYVAAGLAQGLDLRDAQHQANDALLARRARFGEAK